MRVPFRPVIGTLAGLGSLLFLLPLASLALRAPWTSTPAIVAAPDVRGSLGLSAACSLASTALAILLGVPLAWVLARLKFPGLGLLRGIATLPVVLPPVVGGVALLLAFGRRGLVGGPVATALGGIGLPFTTAGVIVAETFVAMPLLVITVEAGLRSMDARYEEVARSLGAGRWMVFRRVTLPLLGPSLLAGTLLAWARALGEFGATITFAGNLPGTTQTAPLAIYSELDFQQLPGATVLSLLLLGLSLAVLVVLRGRYGGLGH